MIALSTSSITTARSVAGAFAAPSAVVMRPSSGSQSLADRPVAEQGIPSLRRVHLRIQESTCSETAGFGDLATQPGVAWAVSASASSAGEVTRVKPSPASQPWLRAVQVVVGVVAVERHDEPGVGSPPASDAARRAARR